MTTAINPVGLDPHGAVVRLLPAGQSSGRVAAGWLPAGAHLAMAFGSMSGELLASSSHRSPELAALFYGASDDRAGDEAGGGKDYAFGCVRIAGRCYVKLGVTGII